MNQSLQSSKNMTKISRNQVMNFVWAPQPLIVTILFKSRVEGMKGFFKQLFEQESEICFESMCCTLTIDMFVFSWKQQVPNYYEVYVCSDFPISCCYLETYQLHFDYH